MARDPGQKAARDPQAEWEARQAEGRALAPALIGLDGEAAANRARERGFEAQVVPHDVDALTADLRYNRLRLFLDETGTVIRVHAG